MTILIGLRQSSLIKKLLWTLLLIMAVSGCEAMKTSGSLTEAAIKQIKLNNQRKKEKIAQQKAVAKTPEIVAAENLVKQNPDNPEVAYNLGLLYWQDYERTNRPFSRDQAVTVFEFVLAMVPGNASTIKVLYNIYYNDSIGGDANAVVKAKNYFNQLTPEYRRELNPPALAQYIQNYYQQQKKSAWDYPGLRATLLQAMQEQPHSSFSYIELAKLYSMQSYYPLAIATLKLGLEENPDSAEILKAIGSTYETRALMQGCHYDNPDLLYKASNYYLQAVSGQTEVADLHRGLARLFIDRNLPQLAAYETALLIDVEANAANYAFAAHNLALIGKKDSANYYLDAARSAGLSTSDPAYHEVYMINGDWLKAALSFTDYIQTKKQLQVYDVIKADIIASQSEVKFSSLLADKQVIYGDDWQTLIHAWWQNKISEEEMKPLLSNQCEKAEFYFYAGYKFLQAGDKQSALTAFNKSLEQNTFRFIERSLAKSFLAGMK
jgi:hypothetical protein